MRQKWRWSYLIVMSVLSALGAAISAPIAMLSLLFKPGQDATLLGWTCYVSVLACPITCVVSLASSWASHNSGRSRLACLLATLPLVNLVLIIGSMQMIEASRSHGYEKVNGEWAYVITARGNRFVHPLQADNESFEVLVSDGETQFAKDKDRVWFDSNVIPSADPRSFVPLKGCYGKDRLRAYCGNVPMQVVNLDAFEVISVAGIGGQMTNHEHFVLEYGDAFKDFEVSPKKPAIFNAGWARDGHFYYYGPGRVEGADYATFTIVDSLIARDKNQEFVGVFSRNECEKRRDKK